MRTHPLTDREVDSFFERGFLVRRNVFGPGEVDEIRSAFDRLRECAARLGETSTHEGSQFVLEPDADLPSGTRIHRIVWCGGAEPDLARYGRDPRLVDAAAQLLDVPIVEQLINQAHFKIPGDDVTFEWHQDSKHRRYGTDLWEDVTGWGSFVETVTAVDPMLPDNGPLEFIPGSHHQGHVDPDPETGALPPGAYDPDAAISPRLEPGDVVMFGPFVVHGSAANQSQRPRRAFLNGYAHPDANSRVYPGEGANRLIPVSR